MRKLFISILGSSPAPSAVKAMAKEKLLGEEVVTEMNTKETLDKKMKEKKVNTIIKKEAQQDAKTEKKLAAAMMGEGMGQEMFDKNKISGAGKKIEKKQVELPKFKNTDNPDFKKPEKKMTTEGSAYGITKGDGMSFPERLKAKDIKLKQVNKRLKGMEKAGEKMAKEEVVDEMITLTRGDYASRNVVGSAYNTAKSKGFDKKIYKAGGGLGANFLPLANSHEPEGDVIDEKKKELPTTKMYRKAGNLSRDALSKGLDSKEGSKAQDRSSKIVSTISREKER